MTSPSPLFDKLPRELRDKIYELAFDDTNAKAAVNLPYAKPPSKALVLTCRQAHAEANKPYKLAYRDYWQTANFYTIQNQRNMSVVEAEKTRVMAIKAADLENISNMKIMQNMGVSIRTHKLLDKRGIWSVSYKMAWSEEVDTEYLRVGKEEDGWVFGTGLSDRREAAEERLSEDLNATMMEQLDFIMLGNR